MASLDERIANREKAHRFTDDLELKIKTSFPMRLAPLAFFAIVPLFLTPLPWIMTHYRDEKEHAFEALFVIIFVSFTILVATMSELTYRRTWVNEIYPLIKDQQTSAVQQISFAGVWQRSGRD